jgi:hypothetical protein
MHVHAGDCYLDGDRACTGTRVVLFEFVDVGDAGFQVDGAFGGPGRPDRVCREGGQPGAPEFVWLVPVAGVADT